VNGYFIATNCEDCGGVMLPAKVLCQGGHTRLALLCTDCGNDEAMPPAPVLVAQVLDPLFAELREMQAGSASVFDHGEASKTWCAVFAVGEEAAALHRFSESLGADDSAPAAPVGDA
jgi:hypothetical protein